MDIFLVNIAHPTSMISFPIGLAYIARALERKGIEFDILDLIPVAPDDREEAFLERIASVKNGVFGFGLRIGNRSMDINLKYARWVKEVSKNNIVVFGGPLATSIPGLLFENTDCDYIVMGEGEARFAELVIFLMGGEAAPVINGVLSRTGFDAQQRMPPVRKIDNIDDYAPPLYDRFDMDFYTTFFKDNHLSFELMSSRGCRGNCSFCFRFIGKGFHSRTASSILDEIEYVHERYGFSNFIFRDENSLQSKSVFFNLMEKIIQNHPDFRFRLTARLDDLDEQTIDLMGAANVKSVGFGVESVNQKTLDKVNKGICLQKSGTIISMLRKSGIEPRGSFIIGFPDDNEEDFEATYDFIRRNKIIASINYLTPLPSTRLYEQVAHLLPGKGLWAYTQHIDRLQLYQDLVLNLTSLPDDVLTGHYRRLCAVSGNAIHLDAKYDSYIRKT